MPDYDLTATAVKMAFPTNQVVMDDVGIPSVYVQKAPRTLKDLLSSCENSSTHPAFLVHGKQVSKLMIGKYQGKAHKNRMYSLPGEDPQANINLNDFELYCKNKGNGHHCITAAEWAFLALCCKKDGKMPKGNNSWGKSDGETSATAIPSWIWPNADVNKGKTARVATGTGPVTWTDTQDSSGIWDLNGNVWEWVSGIRLVKGELQVIPYNDAAALDVTTGADSGEWKAVNADATAWENLFVTPTGQGATANAVKLDWVESHWQWGKTIDHSENVSHDCAFTAVTMTGLSEFCQMYMKAMALVKDGDDGDYQSDHMWANNGADERCAFRGGAFNNGADAGVFALSFYNPRSRVGVADGGRPAYYED